MRNNTNSHHAPNRFLQKIQHTKSNSDIVLTINWTWCAGKSATVSRQILGHSLQAISLLIHSANAQVAAVPLASRIHEGVVFSNRDSKTLLDKLVMLLFSITQVWDRQVVLVADASRQWQGHGSSFEPGASSGDAGQIQCGGLYACAQA